MQTKNLEDLIPKELTKGQLTQLDTLRTHSKEYHEVCKEANEFYMDEVWLELNFGKLNINYHNPKDNEIQRVMYGIAVMKGYIKTKKQKTFERYKEDL